jgi:hypothetical protein
MFIIMSMSMSILVRMMYIGFLPLQDKIVLPHVYYFVILNISVSKMNIYEPDD